jgi:hypothetical protein
MFSYLDSRLPAFGATRVSKRIAYLCGDLLRIQQIAPHVAMLRSLAMRSIRTKEKGMAELRVAMTARLILKYAMTKFLTSRRFP